jgi:hypothetical protein
MTNTRTVSVTTKMRLGDRSEVGLLDFYAIKLLRRNFRDTPLGTFTGSKFYANNVTINLMLQRTKSFKQVPNLTPPKFRLMRQHSFFLDESLEDYVFRRDCVYQVPKGKKL